MAVVLSLLVILPALAENTDGQVYQGRTLSDELIVGVFGSVADSQGGTAGALRVDATQSSRTRAYMVGDDAANPEDTFFNGRLYVSNQAKAFNTVLVTHLVNITDPLDCVAVEIRNENTGSKIALQLVPTSTVPGLTPPRPDTVYYQNYFTVVDRDGTKQVENHNGPRVCTGDAVDDFFDPIPTDDTDVPEVDESGTEEDESITKNSDTRLARINASDGDKLTIRAGTHIQEIYVDGEAPTFSEVTPGDGDRFKSAELRIGFEVRDGGAGLRHDGENVVSS